MIQLICADKDIGRYMQKKFNILFKPALKPSVLHLFTAPCWGINHNSIACMQSGAKCMNILVACEMYDGDWLDSYATLMAKGVALPGM